MGVRDGGVAVKFNFKGLSKLGKGGATLGPQSALEELQGQLKTLQHEVEAESEGAKEHVGKLEQLMQTVDSLPLGEYGEQYIKPLGTQVQQVVSAVRGGNWGEALEPIKQAIALVSELIGKLT